MTKTTPIYVLRTINAPIDKVWQYTQEPSLHEQWDVRFSRITYDDVQQGTRQTFTYERRISPFFTVRGTGETKGTHEKKTGEKTSSLQFATDHPLSPIVQGSGYWQYIPRDNDTVFLTQYDYTPRFGRLIDALFRPVLGWATALSFDVLARWLEQGERPATQYRRFFSYWLLMLCFCFVWLYQGIVPKLIGQHPLEIDMLVALSPLSVPAATTAIQWVGLLEVIIALLFIVRRCQRLLLIGQIVLFPVLTISAIVAAPHVATDPFNVVAFNVALWCMSIVALLLQKDCPTASTCQRKRGN